MFEPRIKLDRELYERVKRTAERAGYSSADEFVIHLLEKATSDADRAQDKEEVRKRLQGLGYIE
jgi:metal-responsive CopG/Arc/MetJ family transcriptional regulator